VDAAMCGDVFDAEVVPPTNTRNADCPLVYRRVSVVTASVMAKALEEPVTAKRAAAPAAAEPAAKRPAYTSPTASKSPAPRTPGASPPKRVTMLNALNPYMNSWTVKVRHTW